jgi:hypothetical protein
VDVASVLQGAASACASGGRATQPLLLVVGLPPFCSVVAGALLLFPFGLIFFLQACSPVSLSVWCCPGFVFPLSISSLDFSPAPSFALAFH